MNTDLVTLSAPVNSAPIKRQIPRSLGAVVFLFDVSAIVLAFGVTKILFSLIAYVVAQFGWSLDVMPFDTRRYYYIFLSVMVLLRFATKGHYSRRVPWLGQLETIIKTVGFVALFDCFNYYFLKNPSFPLALLLNWSLCIAMLVCARLTAFSLIRKSPRYKLPVALVGDAQMVVDCYYAFASDPQTGYDLRVILLTDQAAQEFDRSFLPAAYMNVPVLDSIESYDAFIRENRQYFYVLGMDELRGPYKDRLTGALNSSHVEYAVVPHTKTLDVYGMEPHYFFGNDTMLLHRRDSIRSPSGRLLKRMMDIAITGIALIPLAVMTAIVYVLKKAQGSTTPVLYGGERVGMNGQVFKCWKFCTMKEDSDTLLEDILKNDPAAREEWDKYKKLKHDPRIDSKISAILRKTSLDELPQLWNVFVGDMSLVGPRPFLESQRADYGDYIDLYYAVRPGLTGLWQVSGRNETSFQQRVYWDSWYIRNWSLWYDIVILFKTAKVLVTGFGAY